MLFFFFWRDSWSSAEQNYSAVSKQACLTNAGLLLKLKQQRIMQLASFFFLPSETLCVLSFFFFRRFLSKAIIVPFVFSPDDANGFVCVCVCMCVCVDINWRTRVICFSAFFSLLSPLRV